MNKTFVIAIAATSLFACGSKKKPADSTGSGSALATSGSGSATGSASPTSTTPAGATGASSGGALSTDAQDQLQQAVLAGLAENAKLVTKKDASLVGQLLDALVAANGAFAHDAWDPSAVITAAGKDRAAIFKWVRDNTALVPYRGSLRGPVGVMMDRVGNSLDRALLLADVLTKAGLEVRLANAQLSPDLVAKLSATIKTRVRPALSTAHLDDAALLASGTKILGVDPAAVKATTAKQRSALDALDKRTQTRVATEAKALSALVPAAGSAPSTDDALVDHWWVQVHDGDAWSNLDPSLPTAAPGESLASDATDTLLPADIGDDRRHTLVVRVVGEVWHGDAREEATLVDQTFAPNQFFGQKISVSNVAMNMPEDKAIAAESDRAAAMKKALLTQNEFAPVLMVGASPVVHFSVNDRGELLDVANGDGNTIRLARAVQHATKDGVGGATSMLDQMPDQSTTGSGSAAPPAAPVVAPPAFTAEWLEVEVRTPGAQPLVTRRTVFDTLGPVADRNAARPHALTDAARLERASALTGETELLPMFARFPSAFVVDRTIKALDGAREILIAAAAHKPVADLSDKANAFGSMPTELYSLALARFRTDPDVYLDRLNVLALRQRIVWRDNGVVFRRESDILVNAVAIWPTAKDARAARIAQGVRDTDLENRLTGCAAGITCSRVPSTAELYESGAGWTVIGAPQGAASSDHAAGYAIVAPNASSSSWWRIDPTTGETLGMNPFGGDATAEEVALNKAMVRNTVIGFLNLGKCLYRNAASAGSDPDARFNELVVCTMAAVVGTAAGVAGADPTSGELGATVGFLIQALSTIVF